MKPWSQWDQATWDAMKWRNIYLIFNLILFTTSSMFAKDWKIKKKNQRQVEWWMFYRGICQLWSQTLHHTGHLRKRRAVALFYTWRNRDTTTQLLLCHIIKSRKTQLRASPIPELCLVLCQQNCVTVTSSGQWGWGQSLCLRAETPLQSPDTQNIGRKEMHWRHCWGNSSSLLAKGKKLSHTTRKSCKPKPPVLQRISDVVNVGAASQHKLQL